MSKIGSSEIANSSNQIRIQTGTINASGSPSAVSFSSPSTWPKWAVALLIGVPLAAVGAYCIYTHQMKSKKAGGGGQTGATRSQRPGFANDSIPRSTDSASSSAKAKPEPKTLPEKIQHLKNEGNTLFRSKRYLDAKKCYSEAIELAMKNQIKEDLAQSLQNRAACNEQLKLFEEVVTDCSLAIQLDNQYAKAYARRSRGHERTGNLLQAVHDLVAASILTNFQNNEFRERSEKLLSQLASTIAHEEMAKKIGSGRIPKLSKTFVQQFNRGFSRDPVQAEIKKIDEEDYPQGPLAQALRAWRDGDFGKVIEYCTDALTSGAGNVQILARLLRGTMFFLFGNSREAKIDLSYVISVSDSSINEISNARIKLACIQLQESVSPLEILSRLDEAATLDPTNPDIYFHRAQCYMIFSKFEECLSDFRKCRELQGNRDPSSAFHIAHIEFRMRMNENPMDVHALTVLEDKISAAGSAEGFVLLAQLYMENQQYEKADRFFHRAAANPKDQHNAVVFTQQALLEMVWHEDRQASADYLAKALKLDENYSPALELMMDLELQTGNIVAARSLYERCLELAKTEPEMTNVVQAYQIGQAGHVVYEQLGIKDYIPLPLGVPAGL